MASSAHEIKRLNSSGSQPVASQDLAGWVSRVGGKVQYHEAWINLVNSSVAMPSKGAIINRNEKRDM